MRNKNSDSKIYQGFDTMDPDTMREIALKGSRASGFQEELVKQEVPPPVSVRGFAAMDEEKRRQIAQRGGSVARRSRVVNQEQIIVL